MNRLFSVNKVGTFVDSYSPAIEKRRGGEVSVLKVKMRIEPFDARLASALDDGVGGDSNIKATIFQLTNGEPKKGFTRHDFKLPLPRQTVEIYATPDTEQCRVALAQGKVTGTYVRSEKDTNAMALVLNFVFGPVGRDELELIHQLHRQQAWLNFLEAEPLLDEEIDDADDEDGDADADGDEEAQPMFPGQMIGDPPAETPSMEATADAQRSVGENRPLISHQKKRGRKPKRSTRPGDISDPETETEPLGDDALDAEA